MVTEENLMSLIMGFDSLSESRRCDTNSIGKTFKEIELMRNLKSPQ